MFDSYNIPTNVCGCSCSPAEAETINNLKLLYDIKQRVYGIEAQYQMPFTLYFHLDEANCLPLEAFISNCSVEFALINRINHKPVLEKSLSGKAQFEPLTNDLKIEVTQDEASQLKQESYGISLKLVYPTGFYKLFSEQDGLLVIR
jgi:hypothetical protein